MEIGVISDTHGLMRPEALDALGGVEHILHGGDVGEKRILDALSEIAPVTVVRGNVDGGTFGASLPLTEAVDLGGANIYMIHILDDLDIEPAGNFDVVVYGHSHQPSIEEKNGVLYLNPGSAGPRRFNLPVSVARLHIDEGEVGAELIELAVS